jgi:hypothetical protein
VFRHPPFPSDGTFWVLNLRQVFAVRTSCSCGRISHQPPHCSGHNGGPRHSVIPPPWRRPCLGTSMRRNHNFAQSWKLQVAPFPPILLSSSSKTFVLSFPFERHLRMRLTLHSPWQQHFLTAGTCNSLHMATLHRFGSLFSPSRRLSPRATSTGPRCSAPRSCTSPSAWCSPGPLLRLAR